MATTSKTQMEKDEDLCKPKVIAWNGQGEGGTIGRHGVGGVLCCASVILGCSAEPKTKRPRDPRDSIPLAIDLLPLMLFMH